MLHYFLNDIIIYMLHLVLYYFLNDVIINMLHLVLHYFSNEIIINVTFSALLFLKRYYNLYVALSALFMACRKLRKNFLKFAKKLQNLWEFYSKNFKYFYVFCFDLHILLHLGLITMTEVT